MRRCRVAFSGMDMFGHVGMGLRLLRERQDKTLRELAAEAGIGKSQLSKYENGKELPKLDSLGKLLRALSVTPEDFFSLTGLLDKKLDHLGETPGSDQPVLSLSLRPLEVSGAFERVTNAILDLHRLVVIGLLHVQAARRKSGSDEAPCEQIEESESRA